MSCLCISLVRLCGGYNTNFELSVVIVCLGGKLGKIKTNMTIEAVLVDCRQLAFEAPPQGRVSAVAMNEMSAAPITKATMSRPSSTECV